MQQVIATQRKVSNEARFALLVSGHRDRPIRFGWRRGLKRISYLIYDWGGRLQLRERETAHPIGAPHTNSFLLFFDSTPPLPPPPPSLYFLNF